MNKTIIIIFILSSLFLFGCSNYLECDETNYPQNISGKYYDSISGECCFKPDFTNSAYAISCFPLKDCVKYRNYTFENGISDYCNYNFADWNCLELGHIWISDIKYIERYDDYKEVCE